MPTSLGEKVISRTLFSENVSPVIKYLNLKVPRLMQSEFGVRFLQLAAPIIIVMIDHVTNLMPNDIGIQLLLEIPLLKSIAL